jgi:hypothetical protein
MIFLNGQYLILALLELNGLLLMVKQKLLVVAGTKKEFIKRLTL